MASTSDSLVVSTNTSSHNPAGSSLQHSEQVVARHFSTLKEMRSLEKSKMIVVLSVLLLSLTKNTISGDVMFLSMHSAKNTCLRLGFTEEEFEEMIGNYKELTDPLRASNLLAF